MASKHVQWARRECGHNGPRDESYPEQDTLGGAIFNHATNNSAGFKMSYLFMEFSINLFGLQLTEVTKTVES